MRENRKKDSSIYKKRKKSIKFLFLGLLQTSKARDVTIMITSSFRKKFHILIKVVEQKHISYNLLIRKQMISSDNIFKLYNEISKYIYIYIYIYIYQIQILI